VLSKRAVQLRVTLDGRIDVYLGTRLVQSFQAPELDPQRPGSFSGLNHQRKHPEPDKCLGAYAGLDPLLPTRRRPGLDPSEHGATMDKPE
jgi:hypothetical protein